MKQFHYGEKGFTLIELLVVVAILGVLAAVIVPNVGRFIGSGTVEAANTEAHNVQLAVLAYMHDNPPLNFSGDVGPATATGPEAYIINPTELQAVYTFTNSSISAATPVVGGKWASLTYTAGSGWDE